MAARAAVDRDTIRASARDQTARKRLFDTVVPQSPLKDPAAPVSPSTTPTPLRWPGRAASPMCPGRVSMARQHCSWRRAPLDRVSFGSSRSSTARARRSAANEMDRRRRTVDRQRTAVAGPARCIRGLDVDRPSPPSRLHRRLPSAGEQSGIVRLRHCGAKWQPARRCEVSAVDLARLRERWQRNGWAASLWSSASPCCCAERPSSSGDAISRKAARWCSRRSSLPRCWWALSDCFSRPPAHCRVLALSRRPQICWSLRWLQRRPGGWHWITSSAAVSAALDGG